ncbi:MAG: YdcF family protein [Lachnospiraceae bacterium]|nr:YdcF family protein [Lachnospiraceae bacterium]
MRKLSNILCTVGVLSYFYAFLLICYVGPKASLWWLWLVIGTIFLICALAIKYITRHNIVFHLGVKIGIGVFVTICILIFAVVFGNILYYGQNKKIDNVNYLIVLGAKVNGTTVSRALRYRLDAAVNYMLEFPETKAIVSGGQGDGEDISEAEAMFQYMVKQGIEANRIIKEDASTNTQENIVNSIALMEEMKGSTLIVTNSFHVYRAVEIGKKQGIENLGSLSAPTDKILWIHYHVREVLAVIKYKLSGDI